MNQDSKQKALDLIEHCTNGWNDHHFTVRGHLFITEVAAVFGTLQYFWAIADRCEKEPEFNAAKLGIHLPSGFTSSDYANAALTYFRAHKNDRGMLFYHNGDVSESRVRPLGGYVGSSTHSVGMCK